MIKVPKEAGMRNQAAGSFEMTLMQKRCTLKYRNVETKEITGLQV